MTRLKHTARIHATALALAVVASLVVAFPQAAFRFEHRSDGVYQGIELLPDNPWSGRVREIRDGHGFGSIYYKNGKNDPYLFQPLGSMTVAYIGETFSLDINDTFLLSRFILSLAAFLLIYVFVFLFSRDRLAALSSASALLLADAVMNFSGLKQLAHGATPANFLSISQPVNPAMILIPLFGFLISFWFFHTKKDWRLGALSALFLGLNFYNYFYSWTYLYAFGGALVLLYLARKQWSEAVRTAGVFLGALIVAVPYGVNLYRASQYPTYAEVGARLGIVQTHAPLFVGFMVLFALAAFWLWFPREDWKNRLFGLALLLAPFLTMNQQILTGKEMQVAHYHWYFHKPIAIVLIVITVFYLLGRLTTGWQRKAFAALVIAASFATGAFIQIDSLSNGKVDGGAVAVERQRYGPVMRWFNQNAAKEEVVLANNPISYLVTIYTPLNVSYHRAGYASLAATRERLLDSLFIFYRLRGVGEDDARETFFAERKEISWNIYGIYYRQAFGSYEAISDEKVEEILALYLESLRTPADAWLREALARYEVNYVVWDTKADPDWHLQKYQFLKESAVFGNIFVYRTTL